MTRAVGRALSHESARLHVTGRARYVDDLVPTLKRVAHAWPVLSEHARARVLGFDSSGAESEPGFLAMLTAADVTGQNEIGCARDDEPLFPGEAAFLGQPLAWVLGESEDAARLAASRVVTSYEPLPAITSIEAAIEAQAFLTEEERLSRGDATSALAASPHRLTGELFVNGQEHFYLETQAALALLDPGDSLRVHSSTQHPSETQAIVARVLGVPKHSIVVECARMGGAFGGKEVQANLWAAIAALGARKLARPVRVRLTRHQDMVMTGKRHPFLGRFEAGFDADGRLLGLELRLFSDGGFSLDLSSPVLFRAMFHVDNCYMLRDVDVRGRVCRTNRPSNTAFRGFGGPQGMIMIEEVLDRIARSLGISPDVVRERNFYRPGDTTHYGQEVRDADRIPRIWHELKLTSDYERRSLEIETHNRAHVHSKRGLAITPVKFGISFTTAFFNQAGALVLVYRDGSVQLNHGGTEMGQGLHTKILQIAADALGVPLELLRVMPTSTEKVPNTSATAASAGSDLNGAAVRAACDTLRERLAEVAARRFGCEPGGVEFVDGEVFSAAKPARRARFAEIVEQAYLERVSLSATGYYRTPNLHFDRATGRGKPFHYFAYGAAVSEVEVDGFTGAYKLLRTDILHDVGDSLSPLVDRGQVEGGFVQGVGWLTIEELTWRPNGALASSGASTYKLPTLGDVPPIFNVELLSRATESGVVYGSKAVGEPPFMLAFSVREALRAAVAAFGEGGVTELASPATAEAVYWAIERARAERRRRSRAPSAAQ